MSAAERLVARADSWVGYLEKASNKYLDDFTKNAGDKNYTCFGRDFTALVKDGCNWNGQPWCDMFVDMMFVQEFGEELAKKLLGGFNAYTPSSAQYFKNMGRWFTSKPQVGDIIFFKSSGSSRINHTGIVRAVDSSKVHTIEGNTSAGSSVVVNGGCVAKKSYALSNSRIVGYGRPNYNLVGESGGLSMTQYEELKEQIIAQKDTIQALKVCYNELKLENEQLKKVIESTFIYNYVDDNMPDWAKDAVTAAMKCGALKGNDNGELGLSYKDLRTLVREYRCGMFNYETD